MLFRVARSLHTRAASAVGIFGGSFDPPTLAHLKIIEMSLEQFGQGAGKQLVIDQVRVVPCGLRPDKPNRTPPQERLKMLDLAIRDYFNNDARIKIDPTEVHNGQAIPTHALLAQLRAREPQTEFWFIMGADLLKEIERWESGSQLLQETRFIVFDRNVVESQSQKPKHYLTASTLLGSVSSTEVRALVGAGKPYAHFVTRSVAEYIERQRLYL